MEANFCRATPGNINCILWCSGRVRNHGATPFFLLLTESKKAYAMIWCAVINWPKYCCIPAAHKRGRFIPMSAKKNNSKPKNHTFLRKPADEWTHCFGRMRLTHGMPIRHCWCGLYFLAERYETVFGSASKASIKWRYNTSVTFPMADSSGILSKKPMLDQCNKIYSLKSWLGVYHFIIV